MICGGSGGRGMKEMRKNGVCRGDGMRVDEKIGGGVGWGRGSS